MHQINVWDIPTRIFHWSLVAHIIFLWWFSGEDFHDSWHPIAGKSLLALITFRIIWGFTGSFYSRWKNTPLSLSLLTKYLSGRRKDFKGHTPAGSYFLILILSLLSIQVVSGLAHTDDSFFEGPLFAHRPDWIADFVGLIHAQTFNILLALISLHLITLILYRFKGNRLYKSMITGKKSSSSALKISEPSLSKVLLLASIIAVLCYLSVFIGLNAIPQPTYDFGF